MLSAVGLRAERICSGVTGQRPKGPILRRLTKNVTSWSFFRSGDSDPFAEIPEAGLISETSKIEIVKSDG